MHTLALRKVNNNMQRLLEKQNILIPPKKKIGILSEKIGKLREKNRGIQRKNQETQKKSGNLKKKLSK